MTEVTLECPKCSAAMEKVDADTCIIDRCGACGGIWFDSGELTKVLGSKSRIKRVDTGSAVTGAEQDAMTEVECPRCRKTMEHRKHPDQRHIGYEVCLECNGSFFDAGEIRDLGSLSLSDVVKMLLGVN